MPKKHPVFYEMKHRSKTVCLVSAQKPKFYPEMTLFDEYHDKYNKYSNQSPIAQVKRSMANELEYQLDFKLVSGYLAPC